MGGHLAGQGSHQGSGVDCSSLQCRKGSLQKDDWGEILESWADWKGMGFVSMILDPGRALFFSVKESRSRASGTFRNVSGGGLFRRVRVRLGFVCFGG